MGNQALCDAPTKIEGVANTPVSNHFACLMATVDQEKELVHFKQAVKHKKWVQAMNEELEALEANKTWVITNLPPGKKAIGCKWLYKIKYKQDGSIERYKSRLVVLGNKQQAGIDFEETFAPVAKLTIVRSLLAIAFVYKWRIDQMDVKNAFLHGDLQETVYMKLPLGYKGIGDRISVQDAAIESNVGSSSQVCKLLKSLYGLKQAPRKWYAKLRGALLDLGFYQSQSDSSLFIHKVEDKITTVVVYVDDLLIARNDDASVDQV